MTLEFDFDNPGASRTSLLDRPLSGMRCALGWVVATAVFIGLTGLIGGPTEGDAAESLYSTWAIAHGRFACAYPPGTKVHFAPIAHPGPFIAPLWPIVSGALSALTRIGHAVPFPSQNALGSHCSTSLVATYHWAVQSGAALPTVRLGYVGWLFLMGGVIAMLRASGRGRCLWEPTVLVILACVPSVLGPLLNYFHPQDYLAMGLALGGVACVRHRQWVWAGALFGLAVTSQQFALLVLAPILVVVPSNRRFRFVGAAFGTTALVVVPMVAITSGRALGAMVFGSGNSAGTGGTVLWELHLHGGPLVAISRILPIVISMALAWWAVRRIGSAVLEPIPLLSLVATSLSLRLVFEQNLYGYYFMALAVSIILLDVVRGHIRGQVVAWLALTTLAFCPIPWGFVSNGQPWGLHAREDLPMVMMVAGVSLIVYHILRGRIRRYLVAWLLLVVLAFANLPPWATSPMRHPLPVYFWQVVLVGIGIALAVRPLLSAVHARSESTVDICEDVVGSSLMPSIPISTRT